MRFAILSDIHANLEALEAVLADARTVGCTEFVCLGDVVGYNASPRECIRALQDLGGPVVKGNHDEQAGAEHPAQEFTAQALAAILWTRDLLTPEEKNWLETRELTRQVDGFTMVHATLDAPQHWEYVFNDFDAAASLKLQRTPVCFFGHTHVPLAYVKGDGVHRIALDRLTVRPERKYLINVGSVGQPRDGDSRAAYCTYDSDAGVVELRRVEYDFAATQAKIRAAGLPEGLAWRLALGK
ncbi:MAG: metallophosphoesterase family protein [Chthoniobacterales bacterium]